MGFAAAALVVSAQQTTPVSAKPPEVKPPEAVKNMTSSLDLQRESIRKQARSVHRIKDTDTHPFFLVPWPSSAPLGPHEGPIDAPAQVAQPPPATVSRANPACTPTPAVELEPLIASTAEEQGLAQKLLRSVVETESGFNPCAISPKGALGLMQLMPSTVEQFQVADPFDPKENLAAGARFLRSLLDRYGGDLKLALGAYNAGPVRVDQAGGVPPIPETQKYVSDIVRKSSVE
jgi:soluble lytic murein transglycosylase-like protein